MQASNQKQNIKIQKAMAALKMGHCVELDEILFFSLQTISDDVLKNLQNPQFCYTTQFCKLNILPFYKINFQPEEFGVFTEDYQNFQKSTKQMHLANTLAIYAGLLPSIVCCKKNQNIENIFEPIKLTYQQIEAFDNSRFYDLNFIAKAQVATEYSTDCYLHTFASQSSGETHYAIAVNYKQTQVPTIRIHSSCYTGDLMHSLRCDCKYQLHNAIKFLSTQPNGGIILYLMQEGRGIGLANKVLAYNYQQACVHNPLVFDLQTYASLNPSEFLQTLMQKIMQHKHNKLDTLQSNNVIGLNDEYRNFLPAAKMLNFFKVESVNLITNNPLKSATLTELGIDVKSCISMPSPTNTHNKLYLETKIEKMHHNKNLISEE